MRRRDLLRNIGGISVAFVGASGVAIGSHHVLNPILGPDCPDPDIENPVPYEVHDVPVSYPNVTPGEPGGFLITTRNEIDRFASDDGANDKPSIGSEGIEILRGLDFNEVYAVGITVFETAPPFNILGVNRESDSAVHVYVCHGMNSNDDGYYRSWLLVVDRGDGVPNNVTVTTHPQQ
jgi:hypothetical protein